MYVIREKRDLVNVIQHITLFGLPAPVLLVTDMPSDTVLISSTSNFRALVENHAIVDKSSAIIDFLQNMHPVHLLLRPRRSGKTTLLRMFQ